MALFDILRFLPAQARRNALCIKKDDARKLSQPPRGGDHSLPADIYNTNS